MDPSSDFVAKGPLEIGEQFRYLHQLLTLWGIPSAVQGYLPYFLSNSLVSLNLEESPSLRRPFATENVLKDENVTLNRHCLT